MERLLKFEKPEKVTSTKLHNINNSSDCGVP